VYRYAISVQDFNLNRLVKLIRSWIPENATWTDVQNLYDAASPDNHVRCVIEIIAPDGTDQQQAIEQYFNTKQWRAVADQLADQLTAAIQPRGIEGSLDFGFTDLGDFALQYSVPLDAIGLAVPGSY